jgi:hypothetical protein
MKIHWLVANNAYVILLGENLVDIDGKRFFQSLRELKDYLKPKGLTIKNKTVIKIEEA